jgi:coenzyme PQQ precursor peptide PqqA
VGQLGPFALDHLAHLVRDSADVVIMERRETRMYWTTPTLVEICIGLEINGYLPAEF